ncbi:PIG-L deacetylase family protein [Sutcliffiella cohnii]
MKRTLIKLANPLITPINNIVLKRYYYDNKGITEISEKRVLFLAPHVDDETIGAGGTLKKCADFGAETHVIYLTDGSGSQSLSEASTLIKERKKEAEEAKKLLGITSIDFFDEKDGNLKSTIEVQRRLKNRLVQLKPEVIYIPVFVDCHPDHIATVKILLDTLDLIKDEDWMMTLNIRLYEINTLLPKEEINCIVDISKYINQKKQAVSIFKSQAIDFDGFISLSYLKSNLINNPSITAVETYLQLTPKELKGRLENIPDIDDYSKFFKQVNKNETLLYAVYKNLKMKQRIYHTSKKLK